MRIRMHSDQVYETEGPGKGPRLSAGQIIAAKDVCKIVGTDVTEDYAKAWLGRWVQRGVAEDMDAQEEKPASEPVAAVRQPLGTAMRGRATKGTDDA